MFYTTALNEAINSNNFDIIKVLLEHDKLDINLCSILNIYLFI